MDRDATAPPLTPADAVPPHDPAFVRVTGLLGLGLTAAAGALAVVAATAAPAPAVLTPVQAGLIFLGVVTAGAAVSLRADLWWAWSLFGATALLGSFALPVSWDSFVGFLRVVAGVGAAGTVLCLSSTGWRVAVVSAAVLFHFSGIFAATTSPHPQPWVVEQAWTRVYHPYLNFIYMRNAYHFYSPDPGPVSILVFFLKTETGTDANGNKEYKTEWVTMPRRPDDLKDPLGLGYFRRLSLTEQVARPNPQGGGRFEETEMWFRRQKRAASATSPIPFHPVDAATSQYRLPAAEALRYVLPSYASHVILDRTADKDEAARTTVKIYRLEHVTTSVEQFRQKLPNGEYAASPYHPATYRPIFLGEFDARGNLLDPHDGLLYWVVPILPQTTPVPGSEGKGKGYYDFMSVHALGLPRDEVFAADETAGKVFPWYRMNPRK
ncbi:unnamed protein product [Gemmataceae bacterium]|nr:unnamed protein product [Gemmataceae bacterium]VTU01054.1 unnamed protein product [Gemmataceae bacterium]